jgi:hypothetical protein
MGKRVAIITRDKGRQNEAVRSGLGLLLERHSVSVFVLNHEIDSGEQCRDNLGFIDEMGGDRYSDQPVNVERHGFRPLSLEETGRLLAGYDLIVPF